MDDIDYFSIQCWSCWCNVKHYIILTHPFTPTMKSMVACSLSFIQRYLSVYSSTDPPKIPSVSMDPPGEVIEGSKVTLTCSSDVSPPADSYIWYRDRGNSSVSTGPLLVKENVTSADSGNYTCQVTNKHGSQMSPPHFINVFCKLKVGVILDIPHYSYMNNCYCSFLVENTVYTAKCYLSVSMFIPPQTLQTFPQYQWIHQEMLLRAEK